LPPAASKVALYENSDEDGNPSLDIYGVNDLGQGYYLLSVTQELIDVEPSSIENILIAQTGTVAVYMLTTGEIQINVGPDKEGKIFVYILDGVPWTTINSYVIDPATS
jgi:hypothetical protein